MYMHETAFLHVCQVAAPPAAPHAPYSSRPLLPPLYPRMPQLQPQLQAAAAAQAPMLQPARLSHAAAANSDAAAVLLQPSLATALDNAQRQLAQQDTALRAARAEQAYLHQQARHVLLYHKPRADPAQISHQLQLSTACPGIACVLWPASCMRDVPCMLRCLQAAEATQQAAVSQGAVVLLQRQLEAMIAAVPHLPEVGCPPCHHAFHAMRMGSLADQGPAGEFIQPPCRLHRAAHCAAMLRGCQQRLRLPLRDVSWAGGADHAGGQAGRRGLRRC